MLNTILAAIDRSSANEKVFKEALSIAKANNAKLILLHVLSEEEPGSPVMSFYPSIGDNYHYTHLDPEMNVMAHRMYRQQWKAFEKEGLKILRSFANIAIASNVETEFTQITGHPSSTICEFARSCKADALAIGRRGYSGLQEMFLGSISNYVVHHAPCSVLLVQTPVHQERVYCDRKLATTARSYSLSSRE